MRILKKLFASRELRASLAVLEEAKYTFDSQTFNEIKGYTEQYLNNNERGLIETVQEGLTPRQCVYNIILNITADMLGSGHYHVYRGMLSMHGSELLKIYNKTVDELLENGAIDEDGRKQAMADIQEAIKGVG